MTRNPLVDPLTNDVVADPDAVIELHVHDVKDGQVYVGKWRTKRVSAGTYQVSIERWRSECAENKARVIQRAEEVPVPTPR